MIFTQKPKRFDELGFITELLPKTYRKIRQGVIFLGKIIANCSLWDNHFCHKMLQFDSNLGRIIPHE